jgi:hypothetical protein
MKNIMPLVVLVGLLCGASFAKAQQKSKCTLDQTIDFNTAVALATADYVAAIRIVMQNAANVSDPLQRILQIQKTFETRMAKVVEALPDACMLELVTAEDNYAVCAQPFNDALVTNQQAMQSVAAAYAQTGDRQAYESSIREIIRDVLKSIPRKCWYQPLSRPPQAPQQVQQPCPMEWFAYDQCNENNKKAIVTGVGSLGKLNRNLVGPCFRPACPR